MTSTKNLCGLTDAEVLESRKLHGENILTTKEKVSLWKLYFEKFDDPIIKILIIAWVLSMIISAVHCFGPEQAGFSAFLEPIGIFFAIFLASTIGFFFEQRANKAFNVLNTVNDDVPVTVIRNGKVTQVLKKEIVVGDVVILNTGDEVPADGTLVEAVSLQINESALTGELVISKTTVEANFDSEATYPSNRAMCGTTVVDGHGVMEVTAVGDATDYGQVNKGATIDNDIDTPLQQQLFRLANVISKFGYAISGIIFIVLTAKTLFNSDDMPLIEIASHTLNHFMVAVTLIVVSVPEGLPMSVTLSLALSMNRMLKANNLVRKMHACETMGATTVICTDKTGTLTQNKMQVHDAFLCGMSDYHIKDDLYGKLLKEGISINSTAEIGTEGDELNVIGNPTEGALLLWLNSQGVDYVSYRLSAKVVSQLTFSTERKYMATVVNSPLIGRNVLYVKGAPEIVMSLCKDSVSENQLVPVSGVKQDIEQRLVSFQKKAMRTLGLAYKILSDNDPKEPYTDGCLNMDDLTFLGFVAISDPIRHDVPEAVKSCMSAGIDIKIVTGDTPGTAGEIGRQIGVLTAENSASESVITGPDFAKLTDDEALSRIKALKIMCRARPSDKQRLVRLLQESGEVVAVTGDGTNDAPALKAAQVGLSMGDGTSVAKEASDITIIDNSFRSIVSAVMWGRSLYRNIQRFLLFQLTINVVACVIVLLGSLIGTESPLTITQMLWVNLIMDTFAAGALASLPPSNDVMKDKPRKSGLKGDFIITKSMAVGIFVQAAIFVVVLMALLFYFNASDRLSPHDLSWFFTFFVMLQFWNMFNAKAAFTGYSAFRDMKHSKSFLWVALMILIGQILIVTFGGRMFNVVPLCIEDWGIIIFTTSFVLWIGELIRFISSRRNK